jgi:diadenosine tetraphosphate (Ap4A) HIT family hydrolase
MECFFCKVQKTEDKKTIDSSDNFFVRMDDFPVSEGHCEIVPKKHLSSFFELEDSLYSELFSLVKKTKLYLEKNIVLILII